MKKEDRGQKVRGVPDSWLEVRKRGRGGGHSNAYSVQQGGRGGGLKIGKKNAYGRPHEFPI